MVLSPAKWNINISDIEDDKKTVEQYLAEWGVPQFTYVEEGDNKLLLNLKNPCHLDILIHRCKRSKKVRLVENLANLEKTWLKDTSNQMFQNELVLFLYKKTNSVDNKDIIIPMTLRNKNKINNIQHNLKGSDILISPGQSGWFYFKLYYNTDMIEEIIGKEIPQFCNKQTLNNQLEKYFFIQYADPKKHIRIRFKYKNNELKNMYNIMKWIEKLREKSIIYEYQIDTYKRETYRYGGEYLIDNAEDFFWKDSEVIAELMNLSANINLNNLEVGIFNILSILDAFGLSLEDMEQWLSLNVFSENYRSEFQQNRKLILLLITQYYSNEKKIPYQKLYNAFLHRNDILKKYKEKIDYTDNLGNLSTAKGYILNSLIHMSCNRFKGNNLWENKIKTILRNGIYAYIEKEKNFSG